MWTTGGVGQSGSSPCALGAADYDDAIVLFFFKVLYFLSQERRRNRLIVLISLFFTSFTRFFKRS